MKIQILLLIFVSLLSFSNNHIIGKVNIKVPPEINTNIKTFEYNLCNTYEENNCQNSLLLKMNYSSNYLVFLVISYPKTIIDNFIFVSVKSYINNFPTANFRYTGSKCYSSDNYVLTPLSNNGIVKFFFKNSKKSKTIPAGKYTIPIEFKFYPIVKW